MKKTLKIIAAALSAATVIALMPTGAVAAKTYTSSSGERVYDIAYDDIRVVSTDTEIRAEWPDNGADEYQVVLYDGYYREKSCRVKGWPNEPECVFSSLWPDTEYSLSITPVIKTARSEVKMSERVVAARTKILPAPQNITTTRSSKTATIKWSAQKEATKYGVMTYNVDSGEYELLDFTKECKYQATGLEPGHIYRFKVFAVTSGNNYQTLSEPISVRTKSPSMTLGALLKDEKITESLYNCINREPGSTRNNVCIYLNFDLDLSSSGALQTAIFAKYGLTRKDNGYDAVVKKVSEEMTRQAVDKFAKSYFSDDTCITYQNDAEPRIEIVAANEEIIRYAALDEVSFIDIYDDFFYGYYGEG